MSTVHIYEPALCCDTGVCGVDIDPALLSITADVRYLESIGVDVRRHNLASDPVAFTNDEKVRQFMRDVGSAGLPLTLVDGMVAAAGAYPPRDLLVRLAGAERHSPQPSPGWDLGLTAESGSCCGDGCC